MTDNQPHPLALRLFGAAAVIGILGWFVLLGLWAWWMLRPANLPTVTEPVPVLNPGHAVAINSPLVLRLDVVKTREQAPTGSVRYLECESGNLVTLTSSPVRLPAGSYSVVSDNIIVPAKVTAGDTCVAVFEITYQVNPLREEVVRFDSEPFRVLPPVEVP